MEHRYPVSGTFELTGRCNLNCKMCYVHVNNQKIQELGYRERTTKEWIDMAHQIWEAGTLKLLLTGGEPMIRSDFCEIYESIAQMGFFLTLYTNATMITPQIMTTLRRFPPHTIGITLYGVTPESYQKVCGDGNAYFKVMQGIQDLMCLPSKIELRTTIIQDNLSEAKKIEKFIKSLGERVTFNINQTVFQSCRNSIANASVCRLTPKQNAQFYCKRYRDMAEDYLENHENCTEFKLDENKTKRTSDLSEECKKSNGIYGCEAGWQEYTITWNGRMLPCTLMGNPYTSPFKEGFQEAWKRLEYIMEKPELPEKCRQCSVKQFCGACPASRHCETGNINGIPQYFCQLAEEYYKLCCS